VSEFNIKGKNRRISTSLSREKGQEAFRLQVAGVGQAGSREHGNEGLYVSSDYYRNDIVGKPYPGRVNYTTQRVLAHASTVVRSILTIRSHQVAKLPIKVVPKDKNEPPKQVSILEYGVYDLEHHPAFDDHEVQFLTRIYHRIDPQSYISDKKELYEQMAAEFSDVEKATVKHLQEKHENFYRKRAADIKTIKELFKKPDPYFSDTKTWETLVKKLLMDVLVIDRGVLIKIRDESGKLVGLMPLDGATVRPIINEYGTVDPEKAYVQVINGAPQAYLRKDDVVIVSMYPMSDIKYFGYGFSPMETLYTVTLSDIFIDKGNLDYYRKGGSIPEGFISIEPPPSRDGVISQVDQEQLESVQRHLQSIMMGDFTQLPIVSGGKVSWIDFKGKRKDMQYRELAEHLTRKICAVMMVSPQDVGIINDVNRSTSVTQSEMTKSKGLATIMNTISSFFDSEILPELRSEDDLTISFEDDDIEKDRERWMISQQKIVSGVMTINQYRASDGLHPVPWGNTPLQGLRNWKPEETGPPGGMPMPNFGNLPPLPTLPTPNNPGGAMGGSNPMAGGPPQPQQAQAPVGSPSNLKSAKFFSLSAATEEDPYELMVKSLTDMEMYSEGSKFKEALEFYNLHNYPGGSFIRTPIESYEFFARQHENFNTTIHKSIDVDTADPLIFSRYMGSGQIIIDDSGEEPLIKSLTKSVVDALPSHTRAKVLEEVGGKEDLFSEAVERALYKSLDEPLQKYLYEDFYKFQHSYLTDAQIEKVGEHLGLT
jgi:phage portal protein BeeE